MKKYTLLIIGVLTVFLLLAGCRKLPVYYHYEHTPLAGWEKNDTLSFYPSAIAKAGDYTEELALRISGDYPFQSLVLVVDQKDLLTGESWSDTLNCRLVDQYGRAKGRGISQYQYVFPLNTVHLTTDDRVKITIRHDMKREILPGIADVGVRICKK